MLEGFVEVTPILGSGVYALLYRGAVVYIGQSRHMLTRIYAHRSNKGRKTMPSWMPTSLKGVTFDQVFVLPCPVDKLDETEKALIDLYKPKMNIRLKTANPSATELVIALPNGNMIPFNQPPTPVHRRF